MKFFWSIKGALLGLLFLVFLFALSYIASFYDFLYSITNVFSWPTDLLTRSLLLIFVPSCYTGSECGPTLFAINWIINIPFYALVGSILFSLFKRSK